MAALTDEILMAYADGALDPEVEGRVGALLKADPEARARVTMFRATGRAIAAHYEGIVREPVPARLTQFVMSYGTERQESPAYTGPAPERPVPAATLASPPRRVRPMRLWADWRDRLIPAGAGWQLAAASAAALIFGAGAGFLLRGEGQDGGLGSSLAALRQGQIQAGGVLHRVLETVPSSNQDGRSTGSGQNAIVVRAVLTFRTKEGGYCREYEMATAAEGQFQGLACREADGHWAVQAHVAQASGAAGAHVVGHGEVLDKLVDGRIEGDALGESEEKAAINSGWK